MINYANLDLQSASTRLKYFGGMSQIRIAESMPILPVDAPGLPNPGLSFVHLAIASGDAPPITPVTSKGKAKKGTSKFSSGFSVGPNLTALVRSAIYSNDLTIPLYNEDNDIPVQLVTGEYQDGSGGQTGPKPCKVMIVGKSLGLDELRFKRPFCGKGNLPLWNAWMEVGLPRLSSELPVYATNLLKFKPPGEVGAKIPKEWIQDGMHLLYQELIVCRPEVLVLMGGDVVKAFFGNKAKISDYKHVETVLKIDCRPGVEYPEESFTTRVIVTEHPAAAAHDPDAFPAFLSSMNFLARKLGYGASSGATVKTDYKAICTLDDLEIAVKETEKASAAGGYVAFDCEWEGSHPTETGSYMYTVQWSHEPGHARVVYLRRCGGAENLSLPIEKVTPLLKRLFEEAPKRGARLVGHFAKADIPWLYSIGVDLYPHFVGPKDDAGADGTVDKLFAWQKSYYEGAFDTYVALASVDESQSLGLENITTTILGLERYDMPVVNWVTQYCKDNKIRKKQLKGYGNCPEEIMTYYAARDCCDTGRAYLYFNGDPRTGQFGALDRDRFGNSCRKIFSTRMRAWAAVAEMERYGMQADRATQKELRDIIAKKREELLAELREQICWPTFTPAKRNHQIQLMFGEQYLTTMKDLRPSGSMCLGLEPYKATKSTGKNKLWSEAVAAYESGMTTIKPIPAVDKETLIILSRKHEMVALLLDISFLTTAMRIWFRLPDDIIYDEEDEDDEGEEVHEKGFVAYINEDGRVRTRIGIVETGRYSSSGPNLQNCGESIDARIDKILEWGDRAPEGSPNKDKAFKSRSVLRAQPGWYLVSADLKGAEIAAAGWSSNDTTLIEHAKRATLEESDPEWLDLHSDLAASTFKLNMPLKEVKKKYKDLRVAAKKTRFAHYYGASANTIFRQVLQETKDVTIEQIEELINTHDCLYPLLTQYFASARERTQTKRWLTNGFGGYRRVWPSADKEIKAAQGREGQNWTAQGLVADTISYALGNLWYDLHERQLQSRIVLSVHDSIVVECPPDEVKIVAKEILPDAMTKNTPVYITTFDGVRLSETPRHFGVDISVYQHWGIEVDEKEWNN